MANRKAGVGDGIEEHSLFGSAVLFADQNLLGDIHQFAGQVSGVAGAQRRVGQALAGAVGGDEVLQDGQAFPEIGGNGAGNDVSPRIGHQTSHSGDLPHLHGVASGARADHHLQGVEPLGLEGLLHLVLDFLGGLAPDLDQLGTTLAVNDDALLIEFLHLLGLAGVGGQDVLFLLGCLDILQTDGQARHGGVAEPQFLEFVQGHHHLRPGIAVDGHFHQFADTGFDYRGIHVWEGGGECPVQDEPAHGGLRQLISGHPVGVDQTLEFILQVLVAFPVARQFTQAHLDGSMKIQIAQLVDHFRFVPPTRTPGRRPKRPAPVR